MKLFSRSPALVVIVLVSISLLVCCKKAFKSGVGLYSIKQYHAFHVESGDTIRQSDVKISTVALDNGYVSWNSIPFHVNYTGDTVVMYISDSTINGSYQILYKMNYMPKQDKIFVEKVGANTFWQSF